MLMLATFAAGCSSPASTGAVTSSASAPQSSSHVGSPGGLASFTVSGDAGEMSMSDGVSACDTDPPVVTINGTAGGNTLQFHVSAATVGAITFPGDVEAHVTAHLKGADSVADAVAGTGDGTLELNTDTSGQLDLTLTPTDTTTNGTRLRLTGTWSC